MDNMFSLLTGIVGSSFFVVLIILYHLSTSIFSAWLASQKGYGTGIWFLLGLLFGIISFLAIGFAPNLNENKNISEIVKDVENKKITWKCPKCSAENPNNTYACKKCGYKLA
jgi:ribosomal protein L40E